jgi:hypothetical protein
MTAINYLFPPDQIHALPTWRFVVHFVVPPPYDAGALAKAVAGMKAADWKIVSFPFGLDAITYNAASQCVDVPVEVPEDRRKRPNSLVDYESDFWRICGNMAGAGFQGDIYYEAIDWQDEAG